jgi:hypothetical protein
LAKPPAGQKLLTAPKEHERAEGQDHDGNEAALNKIATLEVCCRVLPS